VAFDDTSRETRRERRARKHFDRRKEAALAGLHLPTEHELLSGMPFLANDIQQDMQAFAERLLPRIRKKAENLHFEAVAYCLEQLTVSPGTDEVRALVNTLAVTATSLPDGVKSWRLRCRIYLAHLGDYSAATDLAWETITAAIGLEHYPDEWAAGVAMITAALGWLAYSASDPEFVYLGNGARVSCRQNPAGAVARCGSSMIELIENQALLVRASEASATNAVPGGNGAGGQPRDCVAEPFYPVATSVSAIVFNQVGNANTGEVKKVAKELEGLAGKALPLMPVSDLKAARATLSAEFPYAMDVIDALLKDVALRAHVHIRPTILVGSPGCGKSRFANRLLRVLGVPHDLIPCGGVSDGTFAGTARQWSTGEPSLPVALITRYKVAGPGAIFDEIEKVGTSRHNGQAHDALLAFLERETASRFHDPYVQAPCDLSYVTWLMTANSLEGLSAPLRDRCRVIPFPEPGREHLPILSRQIIADILAEQGLDARCVSPLDRVETGAVESAWRRGSLRKLRGLVEAVLASRDVRH